MKLVVIVALCVAGALADITLTNKQLEDYIKTCLTKTKLSQAFFETSDENLKFLTQEQKSCFLACMFKKSGIITDDGNVRTITDVTDPATLNSIENCKIQAEGDICKLAWCLLKTDKFSIPLISDMPRY